VGRFPLPGLRLARNLQAVGVVLVTAVPVVGINDEVRAEQVGGAGDGAGLGLVKYAPVPVEVGPDAGSPPAARRWMRPKTASVEAGSSPCWRHKTSMRMV